MNISFLSFFLFSFFFLQRDRHTFNVIITYNSGVSSEQDGETFLFFLKTCLCGL